MKFLAPLSGLGAAAALCPLLLAAQCRPGCDASAVPRILGFNYAGTPMAEISHLRREDLPGALKMSGTWVSKLPFDRYVRTAVEFCRYRSGGRKRGCSFP
jgi:hypothetical protein